jgi:hypothetical protein
MRWLTVCALILSFSALGGETNVLHRLQSENRQLREENQKLREEIVQVGETGTSTMGSANAASSNTVVDAKYWITTSTGKRHNSTCKYFKKSKGYQTNEKIGSPCKICGG